MVADNLALQETSQENVKLSIKLAESHANKKDIYSEKRSPALSTSQLQWKEKKQITSIPTLTLNNKKIEHQRKKYTQAFNGQQKHQIHL